MGKLVQLASITGRAVEPPKEIRRPCDYGLYGAWLSLETQLGTIEGYNRFVKFAEIVKMKIDAGKAVAQNPLYSVDPLGGRMPDQIIKPTEAK